MRRLPRLAHRAGVLFALAEEQANVLARAPRIARAGENEDIGLGIVGKLVQRRIHVAMELRAHGVALFGPVQDNEGDAVLLLDEDRLVFAVGGH